MVKLQKLIVETRLNYTYQHVTIKMCTHNTKNEFKGKLR